jgi:REP element-mobilizing transposase RayT
MPNTYSQLFIHHVSAVKYRQALILPSFDQRLYEYIGGIAREMGQSALAVNGMPDHIHICAKLKPAMAPAKFIQTVKANSSKWINGQGFLSSIFQWQTGGWIASVDQYGMEGLLNYIHNQKEHHKKKTFRMEYLDFLKTYKVEYEQEYLPEFFDDLY